MTREARMNSAEDMTRTLEKITTEREVADLSFGQAEAEFKALLDQIPEDRGEIQDALAVFQEEMDDFFRLETEFHRVFAEVHGCTDDFKLLVMTSKKRQRELKMLITKTKRRITAVPQEDDNQSIISQDAAASGLNRRRLPKLNLPTFSGDIKEWLPFWSQFEDIHNDGSIPSVDKFQYLLQAMKPGTIAHDIVKGYTLTGKNYHSAVTGLQERYGRESALVKVYVLDLLDLVTSNRIQEDIGLSSLYVQLSAKLRALETLGVTRDKCSFVIYPLVECCLPKDILLAWHRDPSNKDEDDCTEQLKNLMAFLKKEVNGEDNMRLAGGGLWLGKEKREKQSKNPSQHSTGPCTAAGLLSTTSSNNQKRCVFCNGNHYSETCRRACKMSVDDRKKILRDNQCCFSCLKRGHDSRSCRSNPECMNCCGKHETVMCYNLASQQKKPDDDTQREPEKQKENTQNNSTKTESMSNSTSKGKAVFLKTLTVLLHDRTGSHRVRAVIDEGSHKSYILKSLVEKLHETPVGTEQVVHSLFGGGTTDVVKHNIYLLQVTDVEESFRCKMRFSDSDRITGEISCYQPGPWTDELHRRGIILSDFNTCSGAVEMLIGADNAGRLLTGGMLQLDCGAVAIETKLGWSLLGEAGAHGELKQSRLAVKNKTNSMLSVTVLTSMLSLHIQEDNVDKLWLLDTIGITDPVEKMGKVEQDSKTLQHFNETVKINGEGRVEVTWPWISDKRDTLPSYFWIAQKKLHVTTTRLLKDGKLEEYDNLFRQWLQTGKIEEVPEDELNVNSHYLQHRAVYNPSSITTPTRPVFNASFKTKGRPSLNDCLRKGPNLLELIPTLCTKFRLRKVGVLADIAKAFQQISLQPCDRDSCRFLWWSDLSRKKVSVFRHSRVVFGVNASAFILAATLKFIFSTVSGEVVPVANQLTKSFYVDNLVAAVDTMEEAMVLQNNANKILSTVNMELRGWEIGPSEEDKTVSLLGMKWNMCMDTICIEVPQIEDDSEPITRRKILSTANSVFDPLGFVCPFMLNFKALIQETWKVEKNEKKIGWDTPVSAEILLKYKTLIKQLPELAKVEIPRWTTSLSIDKLRWSLHVFVDGSKMAYACCAFLRINLEKEVTVHLLEARSRVVPVGGVTIPRTELLACPIGTRLADFVKSNLEFMEIPTRYYTDSSTALHWITKDDDWGVFVRNRRKQILSYSKVAEWSHIPGEKNPADLPSRGCSMRQLLKSRWWEGPEWLYKEQSEWPTTSFMADMDVVNTEKKKTAVTALNYTNAELDLYTTICRLENLDEMIQVVGGEIMLLHLSQKITFPGKLQEKRLQKLELFVDENGLLRVKTRLFYAAFDEEFRCPMVLAPECKITQMLIMKTHLENCHGRISFLMSKLREKFWILRSRRTIRQVLKRCSSCRRFDATAAQVNAPPLPKERIEAKSPFEVVGIDLCGPMFLKNRHKVYVALFTCAVYRAIHLELVSSLETSQMKMALRRFVSRRGKPTLIITDNGTNFVGCNNEIMKIWGNMSKTEVGQLITWRFIPPASPWWGGWWERLIGVVKDLLRRTLGQAILNQLELITILTEVESTVNQRPLTYVSEDPVDLIPLTPALFLIGNKSSEIPELDEVDRRSLRKRLKYLQQVREELRGRFEEEYLGQLNNLKQVKDSPGVQVGDAVLVQCDNAKRLDWPIGKVTETIPGRDGKVRVVRVQTKDGEIKRPIQRIYPLEVTYEGGRDKNKLQLPKEMTLLMLDSVETDRGAPAIFKILDQTFLTGIAEYGGCGKNKRQPDIFTAVSWHTDWIKEQIAKDMSHRDFQDDIEYEGEYRQDYY